MNTKAVVNLHEGTVELEGSEIFVSKYLDKFETLFSKQEAAFSNLKGHGANDSHQSGKIVKEANGLQGKQRTKKGGPSCAERILPMITQGFFKTQKGSQEISEKLKELGTPYQNNLITATLIQLVKRGLLRRIKVDKKWNYINP